MVVGVDGSLLPGAAAKKFFSHERYLYEVSKEFNGYVVAESSRDKRMLFKFSVDGALMQIAVLSTRNSEGVCNLIPGEEREMLYCTTGVDVLGEEATKAMIGEFSERFTAAAERWVTTARRR